LSIITDGLGGPALITKGYGFWEKFKEAIKEAISRLIPKRRRKVILKVPMYGDVVCKFQMIVPVEGEKDFFRMFWELILDEEDDE
jgi:hypothetical protein